MHYLLIYLFTSAGALEWLTDVSISVIYRLLRFIIIVLYIDRVK